ncbi:hypothetical protein YYG_02411 [Plasmodium vinckei petteri]|uniref:Cyclic amine resistance locus protein, putative n=1 Tax=Plasmodium vinckei petteri TaxID=138298 RepID=W7AL33_PLAVN|nr:hypothetical protein YYG_02411 [Plasmodium vinckei petteri]CAD2109534.1 cyclic amine resistance locus protein, putative [Plasmodium vinckei petteri]
MNRISLYDFVLDEIKGGRYYEPYQSDNENSEQDGNDEKEGMGNHLKHMSYSNINQNKEENKHDFYKFLDDLFKTHTIPDNALEHMIYVPFFFEKIMSLSFLLCLDNILYDITFMPIQVIRSICILFYILLKNISTNFLNRFIDIKNFKFYKYATTCNFKYLKRYKARVIKNSNKFINTEMIRTGKKIKNNGNNDIDNENLIYDNSYNIKSYSFDKFYGHHDIDGFTYNKNVSNSEDIMMYGEKYSMENNLALMKIKEGKNGDDELNTTFSHSDNENDNSSIDFLDYKNVGSSDEYHSNYSNSFYAPRVYYMDSEHSEKIYYKKSIRDALVKKKSLVNFKYTYSRSIGDGNSTEIYGNGFGRKRRKKEKFKLYNINSFDKSVKKNKIYLLIYFLLKPFILIAKLLFNIFKYIVNYFYSFFLIIYMNIIHFFHIKKLYTFNDIKKDDKTKISTRSFEIKYLSSKQQTDNNAQNGENDDNDDCVKVYKENLNLTQEMNNLSSQIKSFDSDIQKTELEKDEKKRNEKNVKINYSENIQPKSNVEKNKKKETGKTTNESGKTVNFTNLRNVVNKYINKKSNKKYNLKKKKEESDVNCKDKDVIHEKNNENTKIDDEIKNEGFTMNEQNGDSYFYYTCNDQYSEKKKKNVKNVKHMKKKLLKDHMNFLNLSFPEYSGLIRTSLILICIYIFSFLDTSRIYHYIRAQPFMKLYVVLNMLEILERLLRSLGKDLIDNMIRTFIRIINLRSYIYIIRKHYNNMTNDDVNFSNTSLEGRRQKTYIINKNDILHEEGNIKKKNEKVKFSEMSTKEYRKTSNLYVNYKGVSFKKNNKNNEDPYFNKEKNMFAFLKNNNEMAANFKLPIFYPFLSILIKFILQYIFVLAYILTHAFAHLIRFLSLNIAINSSESTMFLILVMSNFTEIKSTVFKKFNKISLFTIVASDAVERFYLFIDAFLVLLKMSTAYRTQNSFLSITSWLIIILLLEIGVDWCKHSYLLKYNKLKSESLIRYFQTLLADVLISRTTNNNIYYMNTLSFEVPCKNIFSFPHIPTRRLGYMSMPVVTLIVCSLPRLNYLSNISLLSFALSIWICLFLFKIILSIMIVSYTISEKHQLKNLKKPYDDISAL